MKHYEERNGYTLVSEYGLNNTTQYVLIIDDLKHETYWKNAKKVDTGKLQH